MSQVLSALSQAANAAPADCRLRESWLDEICFHLAERIDAASPYTYRHSTGVAAAAAAIARELNFGAHEVALVRRAALLHDIGKLCIPSEILDKPGPLTPEEWEIVKGHSRASYEILMEIRGLEALAEIAAAHHERLDGSGYFLGLRGDQIGMPARILAVADVYDALISKRPYRDALPREEVFGILRAQTPHALDAACIAALEKVSDTLAVEHLHLVRVVSRARHSRRRDRFLDPGQLTGGKADRQSLQGVNQLGSFPRPDHGNDVRTLCEHPRNGELRRSDAAGSGEFSEFLHQSLVLGVVFPLETR